jgi:hypothetical protein
MNLPVYQHFKIGHFSQEELTEILSEDLNLSHPVAFDITEMPVADQKDFIYFLEHYFTTRNESFLFPYPVYLIGPINASNTKIPIVLSKKDLPKFYSKKETRMNIKESGLANKNKLIQQEIKNSDPNFYLNEIRSFGETHKTIFKQEIERNFYRKLLSQLFKGQANGQ